MTFPIGHRQQHQQKQLKIKLTNKRNEIGHFQLLEVNGAVEHVQNSTLELCVGKKKRVKRVCRGGRVVLSLKLREYGRKSERERERLQNVQEQKKTTSLCVCNTDMQNNMERHYSSTTHRHVHTDLERSCRNKHRQADRETE